MKKTILSAALVALFAFTGINLITTQISAAMPDDQCYLMAKNKDMALENTLVPYTSGSRKNPFTGEMDTYETFYSRNYPESNAITNIRTLWGNGDADGYIGLTRYWISADGKARVNQRIYGPTWAWTPWGFWLNFPFDDDPSTWVKDKEICNTME